MSLVLDALIYVVAWAHVLLAPYTKVEESFNLHAIHDILLYGGHREAIQKVCSDSSLSSSISLTAPSS
jgi:alpha-1,6-mannosyltransferase